MESVVRARRKLLGADHADVGQAEAALGALWLELDRPALGLPYLERALPVLEAAFSPHHPVASAARNNLAEALRKLDRFEEAIEHYRRAERSFAAGLGEESVYVALPLQGIGEAELARGRPGAALAVLERALALRRQEGVAPFWLAETRFALARALWDAGADRPLARALAREAVEGLAAQEGADEADLRRRIEEWLAGRGGGG
jgi:tetratricopeptide (TPR) repeat protein